MKPGARRASEWRTIAVLVLLLAAGIVVLKRLDRPGGTVRAPAPNRTENYRRQVPRPGAVPERNVPGREGEGAGRVPAQDGEAMVAVVIDDVGFEPGPVLEMAGLGLPLTFAILPFQPFSRRLAARLTDQGFEVILHMPMEPLNFPARDPGEGAVEEGMTPAQVSKLVLKALEDVPQARGLNNHMGSRATADPAIMQAVLKVVRGKGLYFLDSRTNKDTVGYTMAREMGIPALERTVFLDDRREASYIENQVRSLLSKARAEGSAVGIGHADRTTADVLKRLAGLFRTPGLRVVPASELAGQGVEESD